MREFADRLEMRYKPYKYKTYPNEHFYIQNPANIAAMFSDVLVFFDQYLKDSTFQRTSDISRAHGGQMTEGGAQKPAPPPAVKH